MNWINHVYIQKLSGQELLDAIVAQVDPEFLLSLPLWDTNRIVALIMLYKERVSTLAELATSIKTLYKKPDSYVSEDMQQFVTQQTVGLLQKVISQLRLLDNFSDDALKTVLKNFVKEHAIKLVDIAQPLRLALTGKAASPGIFELAALIGKNETIDRVDQFVIYLQN